MPERRQTATAGVRFADVAGSAETAPQGLGQEDEQPSQEDVDARVDANAAAATTVVPTNTAAATLRDGTSRLMRLRAYQRAPCQTAKPRIL